MDRKSVSGMTMMVSVSDGEIPPEETLIAWLRGKKAADRIRDMYEDRSYVDNLISNNAN